MIEPEVYTAGLRPLNKILELDHQLEAIAGLRYKSIAISISMNP
jgi:hypothetical protein